MCSCAECWEAEEQGNAWFQFASLKKVQGKKQLWTSDSTYLSQNEIQTESRAVIYFSWQSNTEKWGEEEEWRKDGAGWNRGGEPRERKGTVSLGASLANRCLRRPRLAVPNTTSQHIHSCSVHENNMFINIINPLILLFSFKPFSPESCPDGNMCVCVQTGCPVLPLPELHWEITLMAGKEGWPTSQLPLFHQQTPHPCPPLSLCISPSILKTSVSTFLSLCCSLQHRWRQHPVLVRKLYRRQLTVFIRKGKKRAGWSKQTWACGILRAGKNRKTAGQRDGEGGVKNVCRMSRWSQSQLGSGQSERAKQEPIRRLNAAVGFRCLSAP